MTVYHLGKDGTPKVCRALKITCPLGGTHFSSLTDARTYIEVTSAVSTSENRESFENIFTVAQRRRMFTQHPSMSYIHPLGTVLISKRGDLWELVERDQVEGPFSHKFTLKNRRSGKTVVVNTDYDRTAREKAPSDFAQLLPHWFQVDGPPNNESGYLQSFRNGKTTLDNVLLAKVRVYTVENELDKNLPRFGDGDYNAERSVYGRLLQEEKYRYLAVPSFKKRELEDPSKLDAVTLALWNQAGRDTESWQSLGVKEKRDLLFSAKEIKKAEFTTKNGSTSFVNKDLRPDQFDSFLLPGGIPSSSIASFKLPASGS